MPQFLRFLLPERIHRTAALGFKSLAAGVNMDKKALMQLSKEDLVEKIVSLEEECKLMKKKSSTSASKHSAMVLKLRKNSSRKKKKEKEFDPTGCLQRKVALKIAYFGWDLMGLQDNPGLDDTVENILFEVLSYTKLLVGNIEDCVYSKCGRTDKGVSAFSQVLCLNLRSKVGTKNSSESTPGEESLNLSTDVFDKHHTPTLEEMVTKPISEMRDELDYCGILNRILPEEIKVLGWAAVDESFNARHKCVGRVYKYFFPKGSLNIEVMNSAAKLFIGIHDFRNFCKMNVEETTVFVRELRDFDIGIDHSSHEEDSALQMCAATISGTGFLYHQVRYMMGILFLIGMGFEDPSVITDLLDVEKTPRRPQYGLMADYPLVLYDCDFENLHWNISESEAKKLQFSLQQFWSSLSIKSILAKSMLHKFSAENLPLLPERTSNDNEPTFMTEVRDYFISGYLLKERYTSKQYKKVTKRNTAQSLEEKIEGMQNRKKRKMERQAVENE